MECGSLTRIAQPCRRLKGQVRLSKREDYERQHFEDRWGGCIYPIGRFVRCAAEPNEGELVGWYSNDGGKTLTPLTEEPGKVERMPVDVTMENFMVAHRMSPEAEAKIVHRVPPCPFIYNGVAYQPEEINKFNGRQLGFTVANDGKLYAFTGFETLADFLSKQSGIDQLLWPPPEYSMFYEDYYYGGQNQLGVAPNTTIFNLSYMNDLISSMQISAYATNGCTLFEDIDLEGDYFAVNGNTSWPVLASYGWNDRASSLVVWPQ